jgi:hypothetical protein
VKHEIKNLRKTHRSHGGRKEPGRWEWVGIPIPKDASGLQRMRLLTSQQGFAVGYALVSASRQDPPSEAELRELERSHSADPAAPPPAEFLASDDRGWKPVFDGNTLDFLIPISRSGWSVEKGAIVKGGIDNAGQTARQFADGDIRIRFDPTGGTSLTINVRPGVDGAYQLLLDGGRLAGLQGKTHELRFALRGDSVTATLDGQPIALQQQRQPKRGAIQFNLQGKGRILSIDSRE